MEPTAQAVENTLQVQPNAQVQEKKKMPLAVEIMEGITLAVILLLFSYTYVVVASTVLQ